MEKQVRLKNLLVIFSNTEFDGHYKNKIYQSLKSF